MSPRATNLFLFSAAPLLVLTGLLAWAFPDQTTVLMTTHRVAATALLLVLAWKEGIVRRSVRRRIASGRATSLVVGAVTSGVLLVALGLGLAWTVGLVSFDRPFAYSAMNIHVIAGVALIPLAVAHAAERWERTRGVSGRRDALGVLALLGAAAVVTPLVDRIAADRRATGSRGASGLIPTIWTFDDVPRIDIEGWRLHVAGAVEVESSPSYAGILGATTVERDAVLDCTGGWASEQRWRGMPLVYAVRPRPGASRVRIVSLTGHSATFDVTEIETLMLATHVGGEPLSAEHGYPVRVVAPGHRGFEWVKWVTRIEVY